MKSGIRIWQVIFFLGILFSFIDIAHAEERKTEVLVTDSLTAKVNSLSFSRRFIHRIGVEARPLYVFPTNPFLQGMNEREKSIKSAWAAHLKYSFQFRPNTLADRIYGGAYQGIGIARYSFGNTNELGDPVAFYLFQGARIVTFTPRLSFNYEWNFGLSVGWHPYGQDNRYNIMMGSKMNAYINTNFYLNWLINSRLDLNAGITLTHFSNGNTRFPNAGINMMGMKVGLVYNFNRKDVLMLRPLQREYIPEFPRHMSYDLVLFGSWRRKGYFAGDSFVPSPMAYKVLGANFASMYNVSYKFRVGAALDWVYDASANVFTLKLPGSTEDFVKPPFNAQIALGISGRLEYVMPYFTVGIGVGANVLHRGGDLKATYQMLILKVAVTRSTFLHVGYNLKEFRDPNFLMLGIGFRFNNKYPVFYH